MINSGICPKCEKRLTTITVEPIELVESISKRWKGASYLCPNCKTILSVEMDPTVILNAVKKR